MKTKWLGLNAIMLGLSASTLMQTLVATTMPVIVRDLGGMHLYSWVFSGYMLASTITIPLFARLADAFGRQRLYIIGLSIFLVGSALLGTAQTMFFLVGCRILQGIGAGAVAPAALASIGDLFAEDERGRLFGIIGAVQVLANIVGPPLGGWITDTFSWRWGFYFVLPIGALSLVLACLGLPNIALWTNRKMLRLDWQGALLIGFGLCLGLFGFQALGSGNVAHTILSCAVSILVLGLAVRWEQRHTNPIIPIPMLQVSSMRTPVLGTLLLGLVTNGAIAYFPLYLQKIHAQTATETGFALLPMLLLAGIASGLSGRLTYYYPHQLQVTAWILIILGFSLLSVFLPKNIMCMTALIGTGLGLLLPVYLQAAQQTVGNMHLATASGLIQMARNMGGAMGIPLLGAWLTLSKTNNMAFLAIFVSLTIFGALGFSLGFFVSSPHSPPSRGEKMNKLHHQRKPL